MWQGGLSRNQKTYNFVFRHQLKDTEAKVVVCGKEFVKKYTRIIYQMSKATWGYILANFHFFFTNNTLHIITGKYFQKDNEESKN